MQKKPNAGATTMAPRAPFISQGVLGCLICLLLVGCFPTLDWREVRGTEAPWTALFPAKPTSHTRPINLNGQQTNMTMTGAQVDRTTYAIGTAVLSDAASAQAALPGMRDTLARNMNGKITSEKWLNRDGGPLLSVQASGAAPDGRPMGLTALFAARENRVYQALVLWRDKPVAGEAAEQFLDSFRPG